MKPTAKINPSRYSGIPPVTIQFYDVSLNEEEGAIYEWTVQHTDQSGNRKTGTYTSKNTQGQYYAAGKYTVTLTVTNPSAAPNQDSTNITVIISEYESINIDHDLDYLADDFNVSQPTFKPFINKKENFTLKHGYDDENITAIYGIADEWTISGDPKSAQLQVRGRDSMKEILNGIFRKTYYYDEPDEAPTNEWGEEIPYSYKRLKASEVAEEAVKDLKVTINDVEKNLKIVWGIDDYNITNEIEAVAGFNYPIDEVLRKLVDPFQHTELYKIDVYADANKINIKKRDYPSTPTETLDLTNDLLVKSFRLSKTNNRKKIRYIYCKAITEPQFNYRIIKEQTILYRKPADVTQGDVTYTSNELKKVQESTTTYEYEEPTPEDRELIEEIQPVEETKDEDGTVLTRQITTLWKAEGSPYQILLSKKTVVNNYLHIAVYTQNPPYEVDPYIYKTETEETRYNYSDDGEITLEDTKKEVEDFRYEPVKDDGITIYMKKTGTDGVTTEQTSIAYLRLDKDRVKIKTTKYKDNEFQTRETVTQSGQLPGSRKVSSAINNSRLKFEAWRLKIEEDGDDILLESTLLDIEQLKTIAEEIEAEYKAQKYELTMNIIPLTWLKKGTDFKIKKDTPEVPSRLKDGIGNELIFGSDEDQDLDPHFIITHVTFNLDCNSYLERVTAVGWEFDVFESLHEWQTWNNDDGVWQ